jgi:two-component system, cell cycle sensor histidine kinase and response regulator CckA
MRSEAVTILLVEDEAAVRALLTTVLSRAGYHVVAADNTNEAIVQAAAVGGPIHLVITDVMLPAGTGAQLAARLSAGGLGAPVLFISGYAAPLLIRQGHLQDTSHFLQKPFTGKELLTIVRQLTEFTPTSIGPESTTCAS